MSRIDDDNLQDVLDSGLFDEAWYLAQYADVLELPMPPLQHYLRYGRVLQRNPGPDFDAQAYLIDYPDVEAAGLNPLLHYVRHGRKEGRQFQPLITGTRRPPPSAAPLRGPTRKGARAEARLPLTALVLTWDIGHNPLGRSYMLAEVLDRVVRNVVIAGFQFPRYGDQVWEPVREGALPVIALPGQDFPAFQDTLRELAQRMRPDIVIACKPRLPSVQLGAMIKQAFGCPLILDIDDHELAFFEGTGEVDLADLARASSAPAEPFAAMWTGLAQHMRKYADEILVSNRALQAEFGGTLVPHVRDEETFDPDAVDRQEARARYGVPAQAKVLLFFGTPREHKGINVLAQAVARDPDPDALLVIVGSPPDRRVVASLKQLAAGRVLFLPNQPFAAIPHIVAMADVVCLPQDEDSAIARFQLPAKAIDAIGMGVPLLVTRTAPLMQLADDGVAIAVDRGQLADQVSRIARDGDFQRDWAARVRPIFMDRYSYASAARTLHEVIGRAMQGPRVPVGDLDEVIAHQRRLLPPPRQDGTRREQGRDFVVFWKQNDSGLYGRRIDMTLRYLAQREDVRRVLLFDAPVSEYDLLMRRRNAASHNHDRLIYRSTWSKAFGCNDEGKLRRDVFVHPPGRYSRQAPDGQRSPLAQADIDHVQRALDRNGIDPAQAVFWVYPREFQAPALIDHFRPHRVVVDVVDDHRAWPGIGPDEHVRLTDNYRELLARADMSFANCEAVVEAMRGFAPTIRLVPNGCDEQVAGMPARPSPALAALAGSGRRKIGFVGNLEQKIDIALIEKVALRFPECQVVLVGSTHANPDVLALERHANVVMPGVVPYDEVGAWVGLFDVGMIPHLDMAMTRSMNPLKLYVYLACRVPVVATDVFNIDRPEGLVRVGENHEAFIAHVAATLEQGRPPEAEFARYVRAHGWAARFGPHMDELLGATGARAG